MEILKKYFGFLSILFLLPFFLGNKGCEGKSWEHPPVGRTSDCTQCHPDGMSPDVKPKWHDAVFSKEHGRDVKRFGAGTTTNCMVCHTQSTCTECHLREKPKDHTEFFKQKGHGLSVGLDRGRCMTCHKVDTCQRCHMETQPRDHAAGWGSPMNRHCLNCHFPIRSSGGESCRVCHTSTPSHATQPMQPNNALHRAGADCKTCHFPLRHPDNGMACVACHSRQ